MKARISGMKKKNSFIKGGSVVPYEKKKKKMERFKGGKKGVKK